MSDEKLSREEIDRQKQAMSNWQARIMSAMQSSSNPLESLKLVRDQLTVIINACEGNKEAQETLLNS
jgi:hypothetical protein